MQNDSDKKIIFIAGVFLCIMNTLFATPLHDCIHQAADLVKRYKTQCEQRCQSTSSEAVEDDYDLSEEMEFCIARFRGLLGELARSGINPNAYDQCGYTAFHLAIKYGLKAFVEECIRSSVIDLTLPTSDGTTVDDFAQQVGYDRPWRELAQTRRVRQKRSSLRSRAFVQSYEQHLSSQEDLTQHDNGI